MVLSQVLPLEGREPKFLASSLVIHGRTTAVEIRRASLLQALGLQLPSNVEIPQYPWTVEAAQVLCEMGVGNDLQSCEFCLLPEASVS